MKKFILTVFACLMIMATSANAAILKDDAGFSYVDNYNYLVFSEGVYICGVYNLSSINILADNNQRFECNVISLAIHVEDGYIYDRFITNFREDYGTGNIYKDGTPLEKCHYKTGDKTFKEIYYKLKSAALSR